MYEKEREQERQAFERKQAVNQCSTSAAGALGGLVDARPVRGSCLRQRIYETLNDAERASRRAQAAQRAKEIIDAHPEFAELLDALNEF